MIEPPSKRILMLIVLLSGALCWFDAAVREKALVYRSLDTLVLEQWTSYQSTRTRLENYSAHEAILEALPQSASVQGALTALRSRHLEESSAYAQDHEGERISRNQDRVSAQIYDYGRVTTALGIAILLALPSLVVRVQWLCWVGMAYGAGAIGFGVYVMLAEYGRL